jgi:hypothetical protein
MKTVFPDWSDAAFRGALATAALVLVLAVLGPIIYVRTPYHQRREFPLDQPVQFDHRHHVRDDNIDCLYCHSSARRTPYAGIPSAELCMGCHSQVWGWSLQLEPVRRSYFSGKPLVWQRVHELPDYVYFDHSIHVNKGVGCVSCHGRVDRMALDYQVAPLSMGWCLDCHRAPEEHLVPRDQITRMEPSQNDGRALAQLYGTRHLTHCTACHR